jgi:outer membrane receptor protein involved in Fe transport
MALRTGIVGVPPLAVIRRLNEEGDTIVDLDEAQIKAPIELSAINANDVKYINSEKADVYGVEAEYRTRLDHWWEPLDEFTLGFNAAYIVSEVPISKFDQASASGITATRASPALL